MQNTDYNHQMELSPLQYVSKIAPDVLTGAYLVRGSKNVLISDEQVVEGRKGTTLNGQAKTDFFGIKWANKEEWITNTGVSYSFRCFFNSLQVKYNGLWREIKTGLGNNVVTAGAIWFDNNEKKDRYLFANGTTKAMSWLGGVAEYDSHTASTLKKKDGGTPVATKVVNFTTGGLLFGYSTSSTNQTTLNTMTGNGGMDNFYDKGFRVGDQFTLAGLPAGVAGNNGTYTIQAINQTTNEIIVTTTFATSGGFASAGTGTMTGTANALSSNGSGKTWYQARFPTTGTKKFTLLGVLYTYTGGENTDTLTGITPALPATIPAGTLIFSEVQDHTPAGASFPVGQDFDIIAVSTNQCWYASSKRNDFWLSNQNDFTVLTYTTPLRKAGEGGYARLDQNIVAMHPDEGGVMAISCGKSLWFDAYFQTVSSGGVEGEELRVKRQKIAYGQGAVSNNAVTNTKNGVMFMSFEPSVDFLSKVRTSQTSDTQSLPVSDPIKYDLLRLNSKSAWSIYFKNYFLVLLPEEGILFMYDQERKIWQPPQTFNASCMSIVEEKLVLHSKTENESWNIFEGTNDLSASIECVANFTYKNGDRRDKRKIATGYLVESKLTEGTTDMYLTVSLGYKGSVESTETQFGVDDGEPFVERPITPAGIGGSSIGSTPVGSFFIDDNEVDFVKHRRLFPIIASGNEFWEAQTSITCDQLDAQFQIIAHGFDMIASETHITDLIKT